MAMLTILNVFFVLLFCLSFCDSILPYLMYIAVCIISYNNGKKYLKINGNADECILCLSYLKVQEHKHINQVHPVVWLFW